MIAEALRLWNDHALLREGCKNKVYADSLGKLTVGIGHLVRPEDNLKIGERISDEQLEKFFALDTADALTVSLRQWKEIGILTADFLAALISINFQLGDFSQKFKTSYAFLKTGHYDGAINNLKASLWFRQTPVRVQDFITAIRKAKGD